MPACRIVSRIGGRAVVGNGPLKKMHAANGAMKPLNGFAAGTLEFVRKARVRVRKRLRPLAGDSLKGNELMRASVALERVKGKTGKPLFKETMATDEKPKHGVYWLRLETEQGKEAPPERATRGNGNYRPRRRCFRCGDRNRSRGNRRQRNGDRRNFGKLPAGNSALMRVHGETFLTSVAVHPRFVSL